MPRLKTDTPNIFGADDDPSGEAARDRESSSEPATGESPGAPEVMSTTDTPAPSGSSAEPAASTAKKKAAKETQTLRQRRARAEKRADKYLDAAIDFIGWVVKADKEKIKRWDEVPERLRASERIIELTAGKNPIADNDDKGRPKILIGVATPTETAHILPPDYTPHG